MEEWYNDTQLFINSIKKVTDTRIHKVHNSLGVYDAYKWYRKQHPKSKGYQLTEYEYYRVIREINKALREEFLNGKPIVLPERLGIIEARKIFTSASIRNGKIVTNYPIDWNATLKLWAEDKESYDNKTLVKIVDHEVYKIYYNKNTANFNNKSFYKFSPNREMKLLLKKRIKSGNFDAFTFK